MIKNYLGLVTTALITASPAAAQTNVSVPLEPNQVLLKVQASGKHLQQADRITISCLNVATGDTRVAARTEQKSKRDKVTAALKKEKLPESAWRILPGWQGAGGIVGGAMAAASGGEDDDGETSLQDEFVIDIPAVARIDAISEGIAEAGCIRTKAPEFRLNDPAAAKQLATDKALTAARADADAYGKRLGLKVLRVVRIDEGGGGLSDMFGPEYSEMMSTAASAMAMLGGGKVDNPGMVATTRSLNVEFVLGPA